MPRFLRSLEDLSGKIEVLEREATRAGDAARACARSGAFVVSMEEDEESRDSLGRHRRGYRRGYGRGYRRGYGQEDRRGYGRGYRRGYGGRYGGTSAKRLSGGELIEFTDMLASLQSSGVTLKNALVLMASMSDKGRVNELAADLASILDRGESLSTAIAARAETFPPIYRGMVAIGERIGSMESVIPQLARLLREKKAIRDRTRSALAYPILVLLVTVLGGIGIVVFLLPRLEELFASLGGVTAATMRERVATLKALAQGLSGFALSSGMLALLCAALRRRGGRAAAIIDGLLLRSPLAGPALLSYETHNFSFAMEALVRGGVPMELALSEAATIAGNAAFRAAVLRARDRVMKGEPLSAAFRAQGEFPRYMAVWVALGESTGQVDRVFAQVACYFRGDIDRRGAYFLALVEPALILLVGGAVLFFVLFFIVPLFGMYGSIF